MGRISVGEQWAAIAVSAQGSGSSLQQIYDTAPIGLAFLSPDCRYLQINQRLTEICGMSVEDHIGRTVRECVPGLADSVEQIVRTMLQTGQPITGVEVAGQRPDQPEQRYWVTYWHPVFGPGDEVIGINVAAEEITERKRAEAALRTSEQQFRILAASIPQLVWMGHAGGRIFWFNEQLTDFAVVPAEEIAGQDWLTALAPNISNREWQRCLARGLPFEAELELKGRDGSSRPFLTRIVPLRDAVGTVYRWIGTHVDISEQKRREEHVQFIVNELAHRTKNLLTVVMAIARQTAVHAADVEEYQERFQQRLAALSNSHELLVRDQWQGATVLDLIATQLEAFADLDRERVRASGERLLLRPHAVQYLGLALHELATNACKHGALSGRSGYVTVSWRLDEAAGKIELDWREAEGPPVAAPLRRGFGHVVIDTIVPRALQGRGALAFPQEGAHWTFEFPASEAEMVVELIEPELRAS